MIMSHNVTKLPLAQGVAESDSERSILTAGPAKPHNGQAAAPSFSMPLTSYALSTREAGVRVNCPTPVDILLGRGKPFQSHPGNQRMLQIVDTYRQRYLRAERKEKHAIVEEVISAIRATGGRFLSRVEYENYWIEVNHAISYRKVGHAFRSKARRADSASSKAKAASSTAALVPPAMVAGARSSQRMTLPMLPLASPNQLPSPQMGPAVTDRALPTNAMPESMLNVPNNGMFVPSLAGMAAGRPTRMTGPMFRYLPGQQPHDAPLLHGNHGTAMPGPGDTNLNSIREAAAMEKALAAESLARAQMLESAALAQRHLDEARMFQDQLFTGNHLPPRRFF